ncbi:hypothetical protein [Brevibacillus invocatus]|uniref:hypothetical protein n=1 Tax=Brevibacillus invocatus TaxID=173959 RepID=UPI0016066942|nr:hypothetical protein [Brevibacillus invocatus]
MSQCVHGIQSGLTKYYDKILEEDPYCEHIYQEYAARLLEEKLVVKARRVYARGKRHLEDELGIPLPNNRQICYRRFD